MAHFGHAVVAGQCLLLGVDRTCRSTLVTSGFHPLRKSATGSGSGSGRLVVEIVGGVTEVSLHVRYGGISGPRSVSYTHLRAHETGRNLVCRLLLEKKKNLRTVIETKNRCNP